MSWFVFSLSVVIPSFLTSKILLAATWTPVSGFPNFDPNIRRYFILFTTLLGFFSLPAEISLSSCHPVGVVATVPVLGVPYNGQELQLGGHSEFFFRLDRTGVQIATRRI